MRGMPAALLRTWTWMVFWSMMYVVSTQHLPTADDPVLVVMKNGAADGWTLTMEECLTCRDTASAQDAIRLHTSAVVSGGDSIVFRSSRPFSAESVLDVWMKGPGVRSVRIYVEDTDSGVKSREVTFSRPDLVYINGEVAFDFVDTYDGWDHVQIKLYLLVEANVTVNTIVFKDLEGTDYTLMVDSVRLVHPSISKSEASAITSMPLTLMEAPHLVPSLYLHDTEDGPGPNRYTMKLRKGTTGLDLEDICSELAGLIPGRQRYKGQCLDLPPFTAAPLAWRFARISVESSLDVSAMVEVLGDKVEYLEQDQVMSSLPDHEGPEGEQGGSEDDSLASPGGPGGATRRTLKQQPGAAGGRSTASRVNPGSWFDGIDRIDQLASSPLDRRFDTAGLDGTGVHVFFQGGGIRPTHFHFGGRVQPGFRLAGDTGGYVPMDDDTLAAGAAVGAFGVAPGAVIHPVKTRTPTTNFVTDIEAGLQWILNYVRDNRLPSGVVYLAGVIDSERQTYRDMISQLASLRVTCVAPAELGGACANLPAKLPQVIAVGAVDGANQRIYSSNISDCVSLFAPGKEIRTARETGDFDEFVATGPLMAAAHVVGAVALLLQQRPYLTPTQVKAELLRAALPASFTTDPPPKEPYKLLSVIPGKLFPYQASFDTGDCPSYDGFEFHQGVDAVGMDITQASSMDDGRFTVWDCIKDSRCVAFTHERWLKFSVVNRAPRADWTGPCQGLYIKKGRKMLDAKPINGQWTLSVGTNQGAGQISGWDLVLTTATQGLTFSTSNRGLISIPAGKSLAQSVIYVTGLVPPLKNIRVVLRGVNHPVVSDLTVLLSSPLRLQEALLFRGACPGQSISGANIIIDDRAGRAISPCDPGGGGEYKSQSGSALTDAVTYLNGCPVPQGYIFLQGYDSLHNDISCHLADSPPETACSGDNNCLAYNLYKLPALLGGKESHCLKAKVEYLTNIPIGPYNYDMPCYGLYIKQVCAPGHGGEGCPRCVVGTYGPGSRISTTACQSCGPGRTTLQPGSTSLQDCVCAPGYGGAGCTLCGVGTWSAGNSFASCVPCASGKTTLSPGSTSATACALCTPGYRNSPCLESGQDRWTLTVTDSSFGDIVQVDNGWELLFTTAAKGTLTFSNPEPIVIPDGGPGQRTSEIYVSGLRGPITELQVNLINLRTSYVSDVEVYLTPPAGAPKVTLFAAICSNQDATGGTFRIKDSFPTRIGSTCSNPFLAGDYATQSGQALRDLVAAIPALPPLCCSACDVGEYSTVGFICEACPTGTTTPTTTSSLVSNCSRCVPGYFGNGPNNCTKCSEGTYSTKSGATVCQVCPPGTTTSGLGASAASQCVCAAGFGGSGATTCTLCTRGSYKVVGDGACTPCGSNRTTLGFGPWTRPEDCVIASGDGGEGCSRCGVGTYKQGDTCQACGPGRTTLQPGSTSLQDCVCAPGYGGAGCTLCGVGTWSAGNSFESCVLCASGKTTLSPGSTSASACVCAAGFGGSGATTCTLCTKGSYKVVGDGACTLCGSTRTTLGSGPWTRPEDCVCAAGYQRSGTGPTCIPCPIGSYALEGSTSCSSCGSTSTTVAEASTSAAACGAVETVVILCQKDFTPQSPLLCSTPGQVIDLPTAAECIVSEQGAEWVPSSTTGTCPPHGQQSVFHLIADVPGTGQYIFKALHVKNDVCDPPVGLTCSLGTSSASPIRCTTNESFNLLLRGDCQTTSTSNITVTAAGQIIPSTRVTCPRLGTTITYVLTATSRDPTGLSDPVTCAPRTQTIFVTNQRIRTRK